MQESSHVSGIRPLIEEFLHGLMKKHLKIEIVEFWIGFVVIFSLKLYNE